MYVCIIDLSRCFGLSVLLLRFKMSGYGGDGGDRGRWDGGRWGWREVGMGMDRLPFMITFVLYCFDGGLIVGPASCG